jgi:hypothetical protein
MMEAIQSLVRATSLTALVLLNGSCKPGGNLSEVQGINENSKIETLDSSKVEFQYNSSSIAGSSYGSTGGLDPAQITACREQMASVVVSAFEKARQAWAENMKGYPISFSKNNFGLKIDKIKMIEKERVAFSAEASISAGKSQSADISTALANAGFKITGFMSRYTMNVSATVMNADQDTLLMSLEQNESFDFWQNTLSVSASTQFDGAIILGAFLKTSPAMLSKFLPMLNSLAEAKGGARLDTLKVDLAQFNKIVFPNGWRSQVPYASYLIAKRVFEKICLTNTGNDTKRCKVPELQKMVGSNEVRSIKAATQASLHNYAIAPAMSCKKSGGGSNYDVYVAIPSDGTQDIGFQNDQKVYLYKANGNRWSKTGEYGSALFQEQPRSACPYLSGTEKCIRIHQTAGFGSKFASLCEKIKVAGVKSKPEYGYSSLAKLTKGTDDVKDRL